MALNVVVFKVLDPALSDRAVNVLSFYLERPKQELKALLQKPPFVMFSDVEDAAVEQMKKYLINISRKCGIDIKISRSVSPGVPRVPMNGTRDYAKLFEKAPPSTTRIQQRPDWAKPGATGIAPEPKTRMVEPPAAPAKPPTAAPRPPAAPAKLQVAPVVATAPAARTAPPAAPRPATAPPARPAPAPAARTATAPPAAPPRPVTAPPAAKPPTSPPRPAAAPPRPASPPGRPATAPPAAGAARPATAPPARPGVSNRAAPVPVEPDELEPMDDTPAPAGPPKLEVGAGLAENFSNIQYTVRKDGVAQVRYIVRIKMQNLITAAQIGILDSTVREYVRIGSRKFLLDFEGLKHVNAVGLNALVKLINDVQAKGAEVAVIEVHPKVKVVFETLGLDKFFRIFIGLNEAIAALNV